MHSSKYRIVSNNGPRKYCYQIVSVLFVSVAEISYKISRIRSYYNREMKRVDGSKKSGAGTADIIKSKWAYYDSLDAFLRPQIQPRKSSTNLVCELNPTAMELVHCY